MSAVQWMHFDRAGVERLLAHTKSAPSQAPHYNERVTEPSLLLVGDEGIYLVSNGRPHLPLDSGRSKRSFVVYAAECDPTKLTEPFELDEAKRAIFGGDDGIETLPAAEIERALKTYPPGAPLQIALSQDEIVMAHFERRKPPRRRTSE